MLLGAALLFGWSLLTFYGTGYYYRYDAQTNSVEQISRPTVRWRPCAGTPCAPWPARSWMSRSWRR